MSLSTAIHELIARQIDLDEFTHRFLAAGIYTLCPVRPGLFVMTRPDGASIAPVWSTSRAVRQVMGSCEWAERTGQDLVDHLPADVGVLIDAGLPHPIVLPSSALKVCRSSITTSTTV